MVVQSMDFDLFCLRKELFKILTIWSLFNNYKTIQDYRGYPIQIDICNFQKFPLSDEILRMKNVQFFFQYQPKPNHKLVSPEPHFVEEERNLLETYFKYIKSSRYKGVEEQKCFEMDSEGHLVTMNSFQTAFQLSNESIEHLSNFPHLRNLDIRPLSVVGLFENVTNFSILSTLRMLSITFQLNLNGPALFKDLGLFTNLRFLFLKNKENPSFYFDKFDYFFLIILTWVVDVFIPPSFSNLTNLVYFYSSRFFFRGFVFF